MSDQNKIIEIEEKIESLQNDFKAFKGITANFIKQVSEKSGEKITVLQKNISELWETVQNQQESINGIITEKKVNWSNVEKLGDYLDKLTVLEKKFKSIDKTNEKAKKVFEDISEHHKSIKATQAQWEEEKKNYQQEITEIRSLIKKLDQARIKREEEREKEQADQKKFLKKLFFWSIPIVVTIIGISLTFGLQIVKLRDERKEKINLERHNNLKDKIIELKKSDYEILIKIDKQNQNFHDKIDQQNKDFYNKIFDLVKKKKK